MCLIVEKDCKIEVAEKNIPVLKLTNKAETPDTWTAPLIRTKHKFNEVLVACEHLQAVNKDWAGPKGGLVIEQGFHAYRKDSPNIILNPAIIPEGAEYCFGTDGEIVSNKLIVFSNEEEAKKYVSKN